jgi:hypothetical protein
MFPAEINRVEVTSFATEINPFIGDKRTASDGTIGFRSPRTISTEHIYNMQIGVIGSEKDVPFRNYWGGPDRCV